MAFGQQFLLMQRVKEISSKGTSKISAPNKTNNNIGTPTGNTKSPDAQKLKMVLPQIEEVVYQHEEELSGLALRINHTSRLSERLFQKGDTIMTVATMRKVKSIQNEYIYVLRALAALKEYKSYVQMGLLGMKNVAKDLDAIQSKPHHNSNSVGTSFKKLNDTEILSLVAAKQFFPLMDESTGAIRFQEHSPFSAGSSPKQLQEQANTVVTSAA